MKMVAYTRVSTGRQVASGYGLDAQRATILAYAEQRGWDLTWVTDGQSASSMHRPGLTAALADLKAKRYDGIVVAKLDRLIRSMMDFGDILQRGEKQGWAVVAIDLGIDVTTPTGEMVANVMASVARWERRMIGVRIREAFAAKKARGEPVGGRSRTPLRVARRIHAERAEGRSCQEIANRLNAERVQTPQGGRLWQPCTVSRIASRPLAKPGAPMLPRAVPAKAPLIEFLTDRERQVADLVAGGLTDAVIAGMLGLSVRTIQYKTNSIRRTLGVHTRAELIRAMQPL